MRNDFVMRAGLRYEWLGQSTMRITTGDGLVVYTDPVLLDEDPLPADLILVSHHHVDHCLPEYIERIRTENTKVVAFHPSYLKYCVEDIKGVRTIKIGQTVELAGVSITGVEAYAQRGFHITGEGCGFLMELKGQRVYFSGDTGPTMEMEELKDIDVAMVSLTDNIYTIKPDDMIEAVKRMGPKVFIPVHYTPEDAPEPEIKDGMFATTDPRFFTAKEDPSRFAPYFKEGATELAVLRMLGRYA